MLPTRNAIQIYDVNSEGDQVIPQTFEQIFPWGRGVNKGRTFADVICGTPGQNRHRGDIEAATELARVKIQRRPIAPQHSLRLRAMEEVARDGRLRLQRGRGLHVDKWKDGVSRGRG